MEKNLCIKLYFAKFQPVFPLVHAASFRPSSESALLLLSICSLGALFVGSAGAFARGRAIFMKLNKAILASWEAYLYQGGREALAVAQAATLGQTYGMLSGNPHDLLMTESFHGTIIAWARQAGMFRRGGSDHLQAVAARSFTSTDALESAWRSWAQAEETVRVVLALHIHDSEFAVIFHHEPLLRHDPRRLPRCSSEPLFGAANAAQWHSMLMSATLQDTTAKGVEDGQGQAPVMHAYGLLAGQMAAICEMRGATLDDPGAASDVRRRLTSWYETHFPSVRASSRDTLCLAILWHEAFMALYISFDLLERVIGREGSQGDDEDVRRICAWVNKVEGRRCLMHAALIYKRLQALPISATPAIHVPKALFYAGLVIYCHVKFRSAAVAAAHGDLDMAEIRASELRYTADLPAAAIHQPDSSSLYGIADLLRRQGHWELSRRFGFILEALIDDLTGSGADGH
ncbi:hypothetical protein JDV02_002472 [Purpureocillium takamizusanense]|uniref:Xylanolytic transcriptional activator regulatory domain-containing protein n=1 Tax=Purpureocillium takamizusanense TaxID=2060973 RepID=A0A9Q8V8P1_9HYPO|nr:uncharacterized protein JDV02_002472 [Purpureocillium takamizusanense]UNI15992.1 hypothetical protein JDV02_002472 [Purpureocillium takamizusanense]